MNLSNIYNDISITFSKQAGIKRVLKKINLAHKTIFGLQQGILSFN